MLITETSQNKHADRKVVADAYTLFLVSLMLVVTVGTAMQACSYLWGQVLTEIALVFVPAVLYVKLKQVPISQSLRWRPITIGLILRSIVLGITAWGVAMLIYLPTSKMVGWILGPDPLANYLVKTLPKTMPEIVIAFLVISILPGLCEETLFRGAIQGTFEKKGAYIGILLTAILFAVYHLNPWSFLPAIVLGALFGFLTVRTNSIVPAMLCHAFNNATAVTVTLLVKNDGYSFYIIIALLASLFVLALIEFIYRTRHIKQVPSILTEVSASLPLRLKKVLGRVVLIFIIFLISALIPMRIFFRGYRMTSDHLVPQVYPGDRVLVLRNNYFEISIQPGDIIAFRQDGHTALRRVTRVNTNSVWVTESDNNKVESEILRQNIVGKMVYHFSIGR